MTKGKLGGPTRIVTVNYKTLNGGGSRRISIENTKSGIDAIDRAVEYVRKTVRGVVEIDGSI